MEKKKQNIPILSLLDFKENHFKKNTDELLKDVNTSQFFIHSFKDDSIHLNLPIPPHKKTINDFVFVCKGEIIKNIGIESFHLKENDFLFTPKNNITTTVSISEDIEGFYCNFSDEFIGANPFIGSLFNYPNSQNYIHTNQKDTSSLIFLLNHIVKLYKDQNQNNNNLRLIPFYLSTVIAELFLAKKDQNLISNQSKNIISDFKNIVHKLFKQNLAIKDYAAHLNISPNHLNKRVKFETGKTASEIIKEIIILEAKVLLLQTKLTINEISTELGYEDASYFSRLFKIETGFTPTNYRLSIDLS